MKEDSIDRVIDLLARIAAAVEVIANAKHTDAGVAFPWGDARVDSRLTSINNWRDDRPCTFEQMISIGRRALVNGTSGKTKNIGATSISKIDPIFDEYGFGDKWRAS